jgi:membrane protein YqaA with SNARE-associated domain
MFDSLYSRLTALAEGPRAEGALAAVAFAESSFFPVPPDVLLAPMALAKPERAWRYALIATVASVLGGMLGYAIGAVLYDTIGQWLVSLYGYGAKMEALKQTYAAWGWLVILVKGVTPIPYKLVTITSGLLGYNFPLFVALSVVTRGARFFLVAGALRWLGEPLRAAMERNFAVVLGGFAALVVAGFVVAIKVF